MKERCTRCGGEEDSTVLVFLMGDDGVDRFFHPACVVEDTAEHTIDDLLGDRAPRPAPPDHPG